jgi:lactoylglutathione lyase
MLIDHIAIWTNQLEFMKDFYVRCFACKVSHRYENRQKRFSSYFLSFDGDARIEIMQREDITQPINGEKIGLAHFALRVESKEEVDRITASLESAGVIVAGYPRTTGDGYYESVLLDPDGNRIELVAGK